MIKKVLRKVLGSKNQRTLKGFGDVIDKINSFEQEYSAFDDGLLKEKTDEFKKRLSNGESIDKILPEAFAVCREMSKRVLGMRHYDVQMIGGIVLNGHNIAEMRTGEGKTLVATLPVYLNALTGEQVHVVTVNDYLARRDAELMRPLYEALGLRVGFLQSSMNNEERRFVYHLNDIVYGTNSEFAFDFLRDNMATSPDELLQRGLHFALIDEVDSILIDEARTPLIISGQGERDVKTIETSLLIAREFNVFILPESQKGQEDEYQHYDAIISEKGKQVKITENGYAKVESYLVKKDVIEHAGELYSQKFLHVLGLVSTTLKALHLYHNHVDYLVSDNKIKIINAHTGRLEEGRRWSDGLHQAIEAKEGVEILSDNQSLASISLQNFYRLYSKLAGMTGTADTEAFEFNEVYGMDVIVIPTHKPLLRFDARDHVFLSEQAKFNAVIADIEEKHLINRPVLVGTASVRESEILSQLLTEKGLIHNVLNAKNHEQEAGIIAQAGRPGAITIATNMAGRGTDIILGGNAKELISSIVEPEPDIIAAIKNNCLEANKIVLTAGGLHVIGTTRHDSRRVDNQLMGRSGRQGDPGSSIFYVSLEDELMRLFGGNKYMNMFRTLGIEDDDCITHRFIDKAIADAQHKVEQQHYNMRKELLKYDDINNMQRKEIYEMRKEWLMSTDVSKQAIEIIKMATTKVIDKYIPAGHFMETWDVQGIDDYLRFNWGVECNVVENSSHDSLSDDVIHQDIKDSVHNTIELISKELPKEAFEVLSKTLMLHVIDQHWREQIESLDQLREGIHLRGYAQKNPIQEYGLDSMEFFKSMIESIQERYATAFFRSMYETIHHYRLQNQIEKNVINDDIE
jgi:preprotein translocase, SecA subunit